MSHKKSEQCSRNKTLIKMLSKNNMIKMNSECEHEHIQTEEKKKEHHPYKGTIIDYSG